MELNSKIYVAGHRGLVGSISFPPCLNVGATYIVCTYAREF